MLANAIKTLGETPLHKLLSGCAAKFINLNNGWGLKFYRSASTRDKTYDKQNRAYNLGIGPKVGQRTNFVLDGTVYYGYLTEVVDVVKDRYTADFGLGHRMGDWSTEMREDAVHYWKGMEEWPDYIELIQKLEDAGFDSFDMHWANVGYTADGRFVAIDFDNT